MTMTPASLVRLCTLAAGVLFVSGALAFGDEGHEVVALVAHAHMSAKAIAEADRLLQSDTSAYRMADGGMTSDSFERQATWADYFRDSQRATGKLPEQIHSYFWHFVDTEIRGGSLEVACFGFPTPSAGTLASQGPDPDCVVNKIEQFAAELASPAIADSEKVVALRFLMHFVGDIHQPLHASDDLDKGGNGKQASIGTAKATTLHHHWDTTFVTLIGAPLGGSVTDPKAVVQGLRTPTSAEAAQWLGAPNPRYWALESYALAQGYAYALPQPLAVGTKLVYALDAIYVKNATSVTSEQLNKAGYRLAAILNLAFGN